MDNARKDPDPQYLHDRAAESAKETRQAVLTLSSGALAVFFLALTGAKDVEPPLRAFEKGVLLISLGCMSAAVFASLWCAFADAQWSYWWARSVEKRFEDAQLGLPILSARDRWHRHKRYSERLLLWAFAVGILFAAAYLGSRISALQTEEPNKRPPPLAHH